MTSPSRSLTWKLGIQDNASQGFSKVGDASQSMAKTIGGAISTLGDQVGGVLGGILDTVGGTISKLSSSTDDMGKKMTIAGASIAGLGIALGELGSADQAASNQLNQAVLQTGASMSDYQNQIDAAINQGENFGHSSADVQNALTTLTTKTGDVTTALSDMTLVENLAAAKHESLASAATQVGQALDGNTRLFKQYGIAVSSGTQTTAELNSEVAQLASRLSGQASAASDTFSGKIDSLKEHILGWLSSISGTVAPAMTFFGTALGIAGSGISIFASRAEAAAAKGESAGKSLSGAAAEVEGGASFGPIGLAIGGVAAAAGLAAVALDLFGGSEKKAIPPSADLASALQETAGALGGTTEQAVAAMAANNGLLGTQKGFSVSTALVVAGLNGNSTALTTVRGELQKTIDTGKQYESGNQNLHQQLTQQQKDQGAAATGAQKYLDTLNALNTTINGQVNGVQALNTATEGAASSMQSVYGPAMNLAAGVASLGSGASVAAPDMVTFSDALALMGGNALSAQQANNSFLDDLTNITTSVKTNGDSLADNTTKGRANQEVVLSAIQAANDHAEAVYKQTGSVQQASAALAQDEQSLLKNSTQAGLTKQAVQGLITTYAAVPTSITTTMLFDDSSAINNIHDADSEFKVLDGLWQSDPLTAAAIQDQVDFNARAGYAAGGQLSFAASGRQLGRGWTKVGEYGSEIVSPSGYVYPHGRSQQMLRDATASAGSGSGDVHYHVHVQGVVAGTSREVGLFLAQHLGTHLRTGGTMSGGRSIQN